MRGYQLYQASKHTLSSNQKDLLMRVRDAHAASGCSLAGEPPTEFQVDEETSRPVLVDPGKIALRFKPTSVQQSMRVEIVELIELLSVLEQVDDEYRSRPSALWQVILELQRWMATELPGVLDEHRGPADDWERLIRNRVDYLKKLVNICVRCAPTHHVHHSRSLHV